MKVGSGKVVSIDYVLTNDTGQELDRSEEGKPLAYLHGKAQIIEGLEKALVGLEAGESKKVSIAPEEAYGEMDPSQRLQMPKSNFPENMPLEPGVQFQADLGGQTAVLFIESVDGDQVTVNANHPLAGQTLHFDVKVTEVREATEEEKEHGHAHGPGVH